MPSAIIVDDSASGNQVVVRYEQHRPELIARALVMAVPGGGSPREDRP